MTINEPGDPVTEPTPGPAAAVRVRVIAGPDDAMVGKIGYLFDFNASEYRSYIVTVTETEVRRLHLHDGYEYRVEEI